MCVLLLAVFGLVRLGCPPVTEGFELLLEKLAPAEMLELRRILRKLLGDAVDGK